MCYDFVSFSKVGAPRKGCSSGFGFWGESLPEETADACPGDTHYHPFKAPPNLK